MFERLRDTTLDRAIRQSNQRGRQIWVVWTGRRFSLRLAYRRGAGTLVARVIGDAILMA